MAKTGGRVYILGDKNESGYYKIGATRGLMSKRLKALQTGNSSALYVESVYETEHPFIIENILHNKLEHKRVLNEWFELDYDEVLKFGEMCKDIEDTIEVMKDNPFFKKKYFKD